MDSKEIKIERIVIQESTSKEPHEYWIREKILDENGEVEPFQIYQSKLAKMQ